MVVPMGLLHFWAGTKIRRPMLGGGQQTRPLSLPLSQPCSLPSLCPTSPSPHRSTTFSLPRKASPATGSSDVSSLHGSPVLAQHPCCWHQSALWHILHHPELAVSLESMGLARRDWAVRKVNIAGWWHHHHHPVTNTKNYNSLVRFAYLDNSITFGTNQN